MNAELIESRAAEYQLAERAEMGFRDVLQNVLTLGKHAVLQGRIADYNDLCKQVQRSYHAMEEQRVVTNRALEVVIAAKSVGVEALMKLRSISRNLSVRDRQIGERSFDQTNLIRPLEKIEHALSNGTIALHGAKAAGAGISTAMGTWALVGSLGTASTGTSIVTLSGAAATNATLAWLGGGSLATGGLGMAGGAAVLGGIVLVPAAIILGILGRNATNKKIREVEVAITETLQAIANYKKATLGLEAMERRAAEVSNSLQKATSTFNQQFHRTYQTLFPRGVFSKAFRFCRRLIGKKYFDEQDLRLISPLLQMAGSLAEMIDVPILDQTGVPR